SASECPNSHPSTIFPYRLADSRQPTAASSLPSRRLQNVSNPPVVQPHRLHIIPVIGRLARFGRLGRRIVHQHVPFLIHPGNHDPVTVRLPVRRIPQLPAPHLDARDDRLAVGDLALHLVPAPEPLDIPRRAERVRSLHRPPPIAVQPVLRIPDPLVHL